jgi:hypothetical protein
MHRSIVDHHGGWLTQFATERIETGNHGFGIDSASFKYIRVKMLAAVVQESQHVELLTLAARNFVALSDRLPTVGDAGSERKSRFVEVVKIVLSGEAVLLKITEKSLVKQNFFDRVCYATTSAFASKSNRSFWRFVSRSSKKSACQALSPVHAEPRSSFVGSAQEVPRRGHVLARQVWVALQTAANHEAR